MNQIRFDNMVAQLVTKDRKVLNAVYDSLVYYKPGYKYTQAFKDGRWDGKVTLFSRQNFTFPVGLIAWVKKIVNKKGIDVELVDLRNKAKRLVPVSDEVAARSLEGKELRDYQINAVQNAFRASRGIIQSPTGSGKTVIAAAIAKIGLDNGLRTLFITHQKELLHQTQESFIKSGIDAGIIGDSERVYRPVTVATVQTLYAGFTKKDKYGRVTRPANPEIQNLMICADIVIYDEAHRGDASSFQQVGNTCKNAYYNFGLTATPLMKGLESDMKLMCLTGDVCFRITIKELVDRGFLAQPHIKYVKVVKPLLSRAATGRKLPYPTAYKLGVTENDYRNDLVVEETAALAARGENVLVLVNHIKHGDTLLRLLRGSYSGLRATLIHGSKDDSVREKALNDMAEGRLDVLISSTITDEGVDINNISSVVMAGGLKSPIKLYQRIGRAMRPKKDFNRCLVVVFMDLTNQHLAKHSKALFEVIQAEPGFITVPDFSTLLRPFKKGGAAA